MCRCVHMCTYLAGLRNKIGFSCSEKKGFLYTPPLTSTHWNTFTHSARKNWHKRGKKGILCVFMNTFRWDIRAHREQIKLGIGDVLT